MTYEIANIMILVLSTPWAESTVVMSANELSPMGKCNIELSQKGLTVPELLAQRLDSENLYPISLLLTNKIALFTLFAYGGVIILLSVTLMISIPPHTYMNTQTSSISKNGADANELSPMGESSILHSAPIYCQPILLPVPELLAQWLEDSTNCSILFLYFLHIWRCNMEVRMKI